MPDAVKVMLSGRYEVDTWSLKQPLVLGPSVSLEIKSSGNPIIDAIDAIKIQLNIDIDGLDPTFAVSGTVSDRRFTNSEPSYFIGRATISPLKDGIRLHVCDFRLPWPASNEIFDQAEIVITKGEAGQYHIPERERFNGETWAPIASIVFSSHESGRSAGVFSGYRRSRFFRQARLFVIRENGASDVDPYETEKHPAHADRGASRKVLSVMDALREAGIRIYRPAGIGAVDQTLAHEDGQWDEKEVLDALLSVTTSLAPGGIWRGIAPSPDLFLFLAKRSNNDRLAGLACALAGPNNTLLGGGAVVFTDSPSFHDINSTFIQSNPPGDIAQKRERFFTAVHELGHAMNLVHSDIKSRQFVWPGPWWQPAGFGSGPDSSFMSTPGMEADMPNVSGFYSGFAFRFDDDERLFLRHAPGRLLQPQPHELEQVGFRLMSALPNEPSDINFKIRTLRPAPMLGEPVQAELRLDTSSFTPVTLSDRPDPSNGSVVITITDPAGRQRLFRPIVTRREQIQLVKRSHKDEAYYIPVDLTVDAAGVVFSAPGLYTVTATYSCLRRDGANVRQLFATSSMPIVVGPPDTETASVLCDLMDRRVAHVLANRGTRVDEETNNRLRYCLGKLPAGNPIAAHLRASLSLPLATDRRVLDNGQVQIEPAKPDKVFEQLEPIVGDAKRQAGAANALGNVSYNEVVKTFAEAAKTAGKKAAARDACRAAWNLFKERKAPKKVLQDLKRFQ